VVEAITGADTAEPVVTGLGTVVLRVDT